MKKTLYAIIGLSGLLTDCTSNNPDTKALEEKLPFVKDTLFTRYDSLSGKISTWAHYPALYIGHFKDTITVDHFLHFQEFAPPMSAGLEKFDYEPPEEHPYFDEFTIRKFADVRQAKAKVRVDTTTMIGQKEYWGRDRKIYPAYPVFIINLEKDTIAIGRANYDSRLSLIMQALDTEGKWREIEEKRGYDCGTGVGTILLPPNQMVLTSSIVRQGNYKTKLRLKSGKNYSNVFAGSIDPSLLRLHKL